METVVIVIHLMVIVALVAVVLMQRSEGGALGIGGSSNFLSTRSQGNILTRSTAILAAAFFATSIALSLLGRFAEKPTSIIEQVTTPPAAPAPANPAGGGTPATGGAPAASGTGQPAQPQNQGDLLNQLQGMSKPAGDTAPAAPATPAAPASPQVPANP